MERRIIAFIYILSLSSTYFHITNSQRVVDNVLETYIVHVKQPKFQTLSAQRDLETYYKSFLPKSPANGPSPSLVYSYRNVITGFAAKLTTTHLKAMGKKDGFLFARPQQTLALHTTHTPEFLGLSQRMGIWPASNYGKGVIIGVLDTGISPNHPSFSNEGMVPPPEKWRGKCEFENARCNNKIIGARSFLHEEEGHPDAVVDKFGHGTHTSSTAAGYFVKGANVTGQAAGTAVGMAPLAHVAMYQICNENSKCSVADILAGIEAAIEDRVDIISLSIGTSVQFPLNNDYIAIGAFAAIRNGIFVSCSAGNRGPFSGSIANGAPWVLTVGASTMDRAIRSTALLGNGDELDGESSYQAYGELPPLMLPLIYAGADDPTSAYCLPGSLNKADVRGKVVLCEDGWNQAGLKGEVVKRAGGAGMIIMNDESQGYSTLAYPHVLPAVHLSYAAGIKVKEYISLSTKPTATISFHGTVFGDKTAPEVAYFSSRGPNFARWGQILKPDILGPGVNVLAAWPTYSGDEKFHFDSGTSMSCPHLSGIAALIKSLHPYWTPAAIKSAMMTSADIFNLENGPILDEKRNPADFFAIGAGHINATRAIDPGLVYDTDPNDYIALLCGLNYTDQDVSAITGTKVVCSRVSVIQEAELNYPSFSVTLGNTSLTYKRTVTNVGPPKSSYVSLVTNPPGVEVTVQPKNLKFTATSQRLTYEVKFTPSLSVPNQNSSYAQGYLLWVSSTSEHFVRSPLLVARVSKINTASGAHSLGSPLFILSGVLSIFVATLVS